MTTKHLLQEGSSVHHHWDWQSGAEGTMGNERWWAGHVEQAEVCRKLAMVESMLVLL